jgi:glycine cleavage system H lipoate-binding protein
MNSEKTSKKDLYYTKDHEWIDFQGSVAYVGVCSFKLLGFKQIEQIVFTENTGYKKQGEAIATIKYSDYQIQVNMPVDGKIININDLLLTGKQNILLQHAQSSGWVALIAPSHPYDRKDLLLPKQYQMNGKSKYAK